MSQPSWKKIVTESSSGAISQTAAKATKLNTTSNGIVKTTSGDGTISIGSLVSGDIPNNAADTTGNADTATLANTVTTNANLTGDVTSTGNATTLGSSTVASGNLEVANAPSNGKILSYDNTGAGNLSWITHNTTPSNPTFSGLTVTGDSSLEGGIVIGDASGDCSIVNQYGRSVWTLSDDGSNANVQINGNLTVSGTTTTINTTTLEVADNKITLNSDLTGTTMPNKAGLEIERGNYQNVEMYFSDSGSNQWMLSVPNHNTDSVATGVITKTILATETGTGTSGFANAEYVGAVYINTSSNDMYVYM